MSRKTYAPAGGGRAPEQFAPLSADPLSRFGTLHQSGREVKGARGFVSLSDRFVTYLDRRDARARLAWQTLVEHQPETAACFRLCAVEKLPQRLCAEQLGLSQPTVSRRLRTAHEFLLAACGEGMDQDMRRVTACAS